MTAADVATLRQHGFDDRAIHDATQIIGYFNYINRVADGLGVEPEDFVRPWERGVTVQTSLRFGRSSEVKGSTKKHE